MNTKTNLFFGVAMSLLLTAVVLIFSRTVNSSDLFHNDVEALSKCELATKDGTIVFECTGEKGECTISRFGYTLSCSGGKDVKE
jgi:hypothetical protein